MSRIENTFASLRAIRKCALIPFVTAGDPTPETTVPLMHAMVEAGASIIELGVPFSDPMADGPVIQRASERALRHHVSLNMVLDMVSEFREKDISTPVVLMGYLNPVEVMGYETFAKKAATAGVDGVLIVDLPPEEADELTAFLKQHAIDPIYLLAPTTTEARMDTICASASGFVYYVSLKGVTGSSSLNVAQVAIKLSQIRKHTRLPVGVGFGIKNAATAALVGVVADAVVIGSAIVNRMEELVDTPEKIPAEIAKLLKEIRVGMDDATQRRNATGS